jgi:putative ABC transport system substrate-binding protein
MQFDPNRRELIALLGGAAIATCPLPARAQERMRRVGVMHPGMGDDTESRARQAAFLKALQQLGWTEGRNLKIELRFGGGDVARVRQHAEELVALAPDVVVASSSITAGALQAVTRSVPIVFVQAGDPVGQGLVPSLARPGGNSTGFTNFETSVSGKWLELLKEIAPGVTRVAVILDPSMGVGTGQLAVVQAAAQSLRVTLQPVDVRDPGGMERTISDFAREPDGGLILTQSPTALQRREQIIRVAAQHRLPAVYAYRVYVTAGGLLAYGPDTIDPYRRAAGYVDRILKGESPGNLPVQNPTKYELAINLRTAKVLGLDVPWILQQRADEVIE